MDNKASFNEFLTLTSLVPSNGDYAKKIPIIAHFQFSQSIPIPDNHHLGNTGLFAIAFDNNYKCLNTLSIGITSNIIDYETFPRAIYDLMISDDYNISSIKLNSLAVSFTKGRWSFEEWGIPPMTLAAQGAQVDAIFNNNADNSKSNIFVIQRSWRQLTHALSGILCASINLVNDKNTIIWNIDHESPFLWQHLSSTPTLPSQSFVHLRSVQSGEAVCTENLTPWTKLLPCMANAGLASLLNPQKIFDTLFHTFDLKAEIVPNHQKQGSFTKVPGVLVLKQNLIVVFDKLILDEEFSLKGLFDRPINASCPVAMKSLIKFDASSEQKDSLIMETSSLINQSQNMTFPFKSQARIPSRSSLLVDRRVTGVGQERGGLLITWKNIHAIEKLNIYHTELLPYYINLFFHTMSLTNSSTGKSILYDKDVLMKYSIPTKRKGSVQFDISLSIPSNSSITLFMEFEKKFIRYTEYPFDANRGFDLPGASIYFQLDNSVPMTMTMTKTKTSFNDGDDNNIIINGNGSMVTPKLLLTMATPDFTMPYNVITFSTLLILFLFGMFINQIYRRYYLMPEMEKNNTNSDGVGRNKWQKIKITLKKRLLGR